MKDLKDTINSLHLDNQLKTESIPNVDLYMDQVIQLFESTYEQSIRQNEKILTKTMINNYAKEKLFFPIQKKKYSKEHLMLINFIYQLKGGLSIQDIKIALTMFNQQFLEDKSFSIEAIYELYLNIQTENAIKFEKEVTDKFEDITLKLNEVEVSNVNQLESFYRLASAIHMSNMYRKVAEKIIDDLSKESL